LGLLNIQPLGLAITDSYDVQGFMPLGSLNIPAQGFMPKGYILAAQALGLINESSPRAYLM
jgi:hypothetical protein